jgi:signal transduction histidine kinase
VLAGGDLDARVDVTGPVVEVQALATSLNEMAASLSKLHDEAKARERLSTFAQVAAGLAHDLRQPIETVRAACADMFEDPNDTDARELFEFMTQKELPRLKRYMDDLQRIAHEGEVQLELDELNARELADDLVADLASSPKWGGVEFSAEGMARPVHADRNLVRRAVYNLAANAADACVGGGPGGAVRIEVADSVDGLAVEFRVRDSGGGIEEQALARLLSGDFHSTKRTTGVGLGFGVARHVALAHGGSIEAESEVGAGSVFTLRLPFAVAGEVESEGAAESDRIGSSSRVAH